MAVKQLQHFAFCNDVRGFCQHRLNAHAADADHHLEGARIEEISDQHGRRIAEQRIGRLGTTPQLGFIDHVVVQQRGCVDELHHCRHFRPVHPGIAAGTGRQQDQRRTQPLAARTDDVLGDLAHQNDIRMQPFPYDDIERTHVVRYRAVKMVQ